MDVSLNVSNYMETALLMLGWVINNGIWDAMLGTGLAVIPIIALILSEWYQARREGDDEGNKGLLTINRIEARLYAMIIIVAFTCMPVLGVSFNPVATEEIERNGETCSTAVIGDGAYSEDTLNSLDGQSAKAPLWWAFVHAVSKGMTNVAISKIPCSPDIQAVATEIDMEEIEDPILKEEVADFTNTCFKDARSKYHEEHGEIDQDDAVDTDWLGSHEFLETSGYYDSLYAERPVKGFPFDSDRDMSRSNTGPGQPGYPTCKEWWQDSENGLYTRLQGEISGMDQLWQALTDGTTNKDVATEAMVRRMVSVHGDVGKGSSSGSVNGYGARGENSAADALSKIVGGAGGAMTAGVAKVGMDMVKQALPMIQNALVMAVVICLPFVMVVSGYSFKAAGMATFGLFAIFFLSFWWELARWMEYHLSVMLYGDGALLVQAVVGGVENVYDRIVLTFVEWSMYFILPSVWVAALGWSGMKVGGAIGNNLQEGSRGAKDAGESGAKQAAGKAGKAAGGK
ncbi:conjugal transfer protein TraG N-terminal domain-containing protein [Halomonas elongata]|uniref:Conjugal transfer protein TraG N-terminal domain-containing protein n=1 Tax=Halomonas elongata (strain ATCC 33173 / DSM 2581 / NBRC 15536 / NCIMB 2198 / 1H9) TaxID=768066 RepID=E1VA67_HALED|nr:conjugal transfer protein TraG N-terminal domain-containing protein [Halomonas elongata]WBF17698.1 conjugal transfer protein TraG N-terminal domain-containing protein [Halomonas elongata]WPU46539.1 conjugal transfer protein TraG N-terminal domain-containing protein [Halomonas elongata DSM 2581]CBV43955.1 secretion cluster MPF-G protein Tfc19 [Halomonas elongata DSM 2581]